MSSCNKDSYDYNLIKKCSKCGIISLKSNFHKITNYEDGLHSYCTPCRKEYGKKLNLENQDRIKRYFSENRNKITGREKICLNNRYKTDINFRLIKNTRNRIYQSLKGMVKSSTTKKFLGKDINRYKKWIEWQFSPEMNWLNIEIDHAKPICMFDKSKDEELKKAFSWKNTQPLLKHDHQLKGIKFNFPDYQLQFIKAYQFLELNEEERLN